MEAERLDLAEAMARHLIQRSPDSGMAHFALALYLAAGGQKEEAREECTRAFSVHRNLEKLLGPLAQAFCYESDYEKTLVELERLESFSYQYFAPPLRTYCLKRLKGQAISSS